MSLGRGALRAGAGLVLAFLYLPLVVVVLYAFNSGTVNSWPPSGLSLRWFGVLLADPEPQAAFLASIEVALVATVLAVLLGTAAAFAYQRFRFAGREAMRFALALPIVLPGILTGVAMLGFFSLVGLPLSLLTVIIGHTTFCLVLVFNNVLARLLRTSRSLEEASADLGADGWQTFWMVTVPSLRTAIVAGALLAFTLSFDEIVVTFFLAGADNTLPLWILGRIRLGLNFPEINAAAAVVIAISIPLVVAAALLMREGDSGRVAAVAEAGAH